MKKSLLVCSILACTAVNAQEMESHGAHVHGEAVLNLVVEGDKLNIILETPAMNVMGFEYEPKSETDLNTSHDALHYLADAEWVGIEGGECKLHSDDVDWAYVEKVHAHFHSEEKEGEHKEGEHKHEHKEGEHKHEHKEGEHKHEHKEGEHKHEHKEGEHKHEHKEGEHKHEHKEGEHAHSDVDVKYTYECGKPSDISAINVKLFERFTGFEKINVQWVNGNKQGSHTLSKSDAIIKFN